MGTALSDICISQMVPWCSSDYHAPPHDVHCQDDHLTLLSVSARRHLDKQIINYQERTVA